MINEFFWIIFWIVSIQDTIFMEIDLVLFVTLIIIFGFFYSYETTFFCLFALYLLHSNKYIGEADLFFLPMGIFLSLDLLNFVLLMYLFILVGIRNGRSPMAYPVFLSLLITGHK